MSPQTESSSTETSSLKTPDWTEEEDLQRGDNTGSQAA
ncbi:hypothetical protein APTSU1_000769900 [Apodemus speciosus]|uniref:Uncharacterized protein n=1 Tax=Apodemus speciosus TaxID=105296 RepID=A0ABQ0EZJ3_APOSI